ncbi:serine/threonine protein kinase [Vittaforma corneae ATCC 50505]|uniref:Serine/threonine protein kinase n=1 Tax=Vittaforma corneae (strain ATCC 50505) TaxID=993615 RepID=L2GLC1_VITCO|nr:serine/threonine protein kinase [Vittaforma corneae ATCC 50505]ELA41636.1 serine/threonine protein kinase [Vittaforma corneae ATCC 50505]
MLQSRSFQIEKSVIENHKEIRQEYRILKALENCNNEHLTQFYGCITENTYVFELCEYNLISFINEHDLDLKGIKKIMRMILLGIHEIHRNGIIHRDIKLGNILVKDDCVKLCDFGLSCFINANDFSYCGTKDYLAPEMEAISRKENTEMAQNIKFKINNCKYDEKIDVYAAGIIYKTLLTRKKESDLENITVDTNIKALILSMTNPDPLKRYSAQQSLFHSSFDDLFYEIPDFSDLKNLSKITKYGKISRISDKTHNYIQIEYIYENKPRILRIECISPKNLIFQDRICFEYKIKVNELEIDKRLLSNSMIKHFNYLCSYFKIVCEKTIKYKDTDGHFTFFVTICNTKHLECDDFKIKKYKDNRCEMTAGDHQESIKFDRIPIKARQVFEKFEKKYQTVNSFHIEQQSSMKISLNTDQLIKKYEFIERQGWALKNGLRFILLLNCGKKYTIDVEEQTISENEGVKMDITEMSVQLLSLIRQFIIKFI